MMPEDGIKAKQKVGELVARFRYNLDVYKKPAYNETQVRQEFINPFFEALGWDVGNKQGHAEQYKDVVHEDAIKVGRSTRAPDYSFRIGGQRKFFVEAKKPSVNIKEDIAPSYQLRRYAWSAKLPLSIVTDFGELSIYDCRIKPGPKDKASVARIGYYTFEEYLGKFDEIYDVFSKDAILKGSFDRHAQSTKGKRGTAEVDSEFLKEIESWREVLAKNIALRNPDVSIYELNYAVQKIIDRIIFLRICEDRGIEPGGQLQSAVKSAGVYKHLLNQFGSAEPKYNSGIFDFKADAVTPRLKIDDKVVKVIIESLYYPKSPYEFSVLGVEILGSVYEQFLGKVIRLTAGHQAKVETKPEVKKAGGVYYTPQYIVDYIVGNTVGKLVAGKTPEEIAEIKILDPACGSGSFLIGAYTYLLKHHLGWYVANKPKKHKKAVFQAGENEWYLTTAEKKRILLSNIFGVDIDSQAVEVTKLSLQLEVLENENKESVERQVKLGMEGILPNLGGNIKCGNSLIGPDFYDAGQTTLFDEDEMRRVNVFDWDDAAKGFGAIMARGGFDCVIGNPPYVDIKSLPDTDVEYLFATYPSSNNRINLFAAFIERALELIQSPCFRFSMIVPTALLTQNSYRVLRRKIVDSYQIGSVTRLPNESFGAAAGDVKVDTVIAVIKERDPAKTSVEVIGYSGYDRISEINPATAQVYGNIQQASWAKSEDCIWSVNTTEVDEAILQKCNFNTVPLEECAEVSLGLTPYDKYKGHAPEQIKNKVFHANFRKDETFKRLLAGNDVMRYLVRWNGEQWISYGAWLGAPRDQRFFTKKRIIVKQIIDWTSKRIWASITDEELYNTQNAFNLLPKPRWSHEYLLGILNSRLMTFYHRKKFLDEFKMRFQKILIKDCRRLPIHTIDFSNPVEVVNHDKLVSLVDNMLELQKKHHEARMEQDKELYERQIKLVDAQIDGLVYDLYGLTEEDIKVVEGDNHGN